MDNKKKKVIINSALAGILATSGIIATAATLTSCNISVSSGEKPVQKPPQQSVNPGFSNFIENINKDDFSELDEAAKQPLIPQLNQVIYPGASPTLQYAKSYVLKTKEYQNAVNANIPRLLDIAKQQVMDKVNKSFGDDIADFKPFANIKQSGHKYVIVYQLTKKSIEDEVVNPDVPTQPDDTDEPVETPEASTYNLKNKLDPFFAFRYEFDFRNISFDINSQGFLVTKGIDVTGEYDINGSVDKIPQDSEVAINLNDNKDLFNTEFPNVFMGNTYEKIEEWNKSKTKDKKFLDSIKATFKKSIEGRVESFRSSVDTVVDVIDIARGNPTIRTFIFDLKPTIIKIAKSMNAHPAIITTIGDFLNPNVQLGDAKNPQPGTLYHDLKLLKDNKIISGGLVTVLEKLFFPKFKKIHPVDYILEFPTTLANISPLLLKTALAVIKKALPDVYAKLGKMKPTIELIYGILQKLISLSPENKIGNVKLLDLFSTSNMYTFWDYVIDQIIPIVIKDPQKAQKILTIKNNLKPVLKQIHWDPTKCENLLYDITYAAYETKGSGIFGKPQWKERMSLSKYFREQTTFTTVSEKMDPNADGQSLDVDLTYRLTFNKEVRLPMKRIYKMIEDIKIADLATALGYPIDGFLGWLVNVIGNVGKALPENIHIMPGDYLEYKIVDPKAFIVPNDTGYTLKAKQMYRVNLTSSLKSTYESLEGRYKLWWGVIRKISDPIYKTISNYYLTSSYATSFAGHINDNNNSWNLNQGIYDGYTIDNSEANLQSIRDTILTPYVSNKFNLHNSSLEFALDLDDNIKSQILTKLGLNPNVYLSRSKFILSSKPGFATKVTAQKMPAMSGITLDISFNTPILQRGSSPSRWVNEVIFANL